MLMGYGILYLFTICAIYLQYAVSNYILCESSTTQNVYWSHASVSVPCRIPSLLHGPGCNLGGMLGGAP